MEIISGDYLLYNHNIIEENGEVVTWFTLTIFQR